MFIKDASKLLEEITEAGYPDAQLKETENGWYVVAVTPDVIAYRQSRLESTPLSFSHTDSLPEHVNWSDAADLDLTLPRNVYVPRKSAIDKWIEFVRNRQKTLEELGQSRKNKIEQTVNEFYTRLQEAGIDPIKENIGSTEDHIAERGAWEIRLSVFNTHTGIRVEHKRFKEKRDQIEQFLAYSNA